MTEDSPAVHELTGRVEAAMAELERRPLAEHPAAFEAIDADIRAALGAGPGAAPGADPGPGARA